MTTSESVRADSARHVHTRTDESGCVRIVRESADCRERWTDACPHVPHDRASGLRVPGQCDPPLQSAEVMIMSRAERRAEDMIMLANALAPAQRAERLSHDRNRHAFARTSALPPFCGCDKREPCEHDLPRVTRTIAGRKPVDLDQHPDALTGGYDAGNVCPSCFTARSVNGTCALGCSADL
jgi:hypothetical protein